MMLACCWVKMMLALIIYSTGLAASAGLKDSVSHTTTMLHKLRARGPPKAFRIVVVNPGPNAMHLVPAMTTLVSGTWTDAPSPTTPSVLSALENHGIALALGADSPAINATFEYSDQAGSNATGAYAVIQAFALTPAMPGFIGVTAFPTPPQ